MRKFLIVISIIPAFWTSSASAEMKTWSTNRALGSEKEVIADCYAFYTAYGQHMQKFEPAIANEYIGKVVAGGGSMALNEMKLYKEKNPNFSGDLQALKDSAGRAYGDRTNVWVAKIDKMNSEQISEQKDVCLLMQPRMDALKEDFNKSKSNKAGNL